MGIGTFDFKKWKKGYNALALNGTMCFLYISIRPGLRFVSRFKKEGMLAGEDYKLMASPILALDAMAYLGEVPTDPIPPYEFSAYANSGEVVPSYVNHPLLHDLDKVIPRISNRNFASDSLPRICSTYQVCIEKLTRKGFEITK